MFCRCAKMYLAIWIKNWIEQKLLISSFEQLNSELPGDPYVA